jgi:small ligand-binding sensory domain FIST
VTDSNDNRFSFAFAEGDSAELISTQLVAALGATTEPANLGFLYATDTTAPMLEEILRLLKTATGITHWTGSVGMGIGITGREYYDSPAVAVMLGTFAPADFHMIEPQAIDVSGFVTATAGLLDPDDRYFGVVHADPSNGRTPGLIAALAEAVPNAFFVGGMTSAHTRHLQVCDGILSGAVSGVLFSSNVPVVTSHTQGCSPFTETHVVTRCQDNILIELDGRPALDVLREDVGEVIARDLKRMAGYIFAALPITGSDTGDYLVRNIIGVDEDEKLVGIGELIEEGARLMFCRRDGASAVQDMERMLDDVARRVKGRARGALYYSCVARGRHQFGDDSEELAMVREALGDIPLVGFFANGEIFHNRLYAYTGVLSVFC